MLSTHGNKQLRMKLQELKRERGFIIARIEQSRRNRAWRNMLIDKLREIDREIKLLK